MNALLPLTDRSPARVLLALSHSRHLILCGIVLVAFCLTEIRLLAQTPSIASDSDGNSLKMIVAWDDCEVFKDAQGTTQITDHNNANALFSVYYVGTGGYHLPEEQPGKLVQALKRVDGPNGKVNVEVGYFRMEHIVYNRTEAIKALGDDGKPTNIYRKALLVTNLEKLPKGIAEAELADGSRVVTFLNSRNEKEQLSRVPALKRPGASTLPGEQQVAQELSLCRHFAVWKEQDHKGEKWLLIGTGFKPYSSDEDIKELLVGWVPESRTISWNTSQAVEYDWTTRDKRENTPAAVFETREAAEKAQLEGLTNIDPGLILTKERMEVENKEWLMEMPRYPVIAAMDNGLPGLINIGFIGGLFGKDGEALTAQKLAENDSKREQLIRDRLNLDVVILLDGTKSMERFRGPTIEAVKTVIAQVRAQLPAQHQNETKDSDLLTRCAIAVYRNKNDPDTGLTAKFSFQPFVTVGGPQSQADVLEKFLARQTFDSTERNIYKEAVFGGVVKAVDAAKRDSGTSKNAYKLMIVVGDSGDDSGAGADLQKAADALNGTTSLECWDFYSISVPTREQMIGRDDFQAFRDDMKNLASKLTLPKSAIEKQGEVYDPLLRCLNLEDGDYVTMIKAAQEKGIGFRNLLNKAMVNPDQYPTELQNFAKKMLFDAGVSEKLVEGNHVQLFDTGWTTMIHQTGQPQWRPEILVEPQSLRNYINFLQPFTQLLADDGMKAENKALNMDAATITRFENAIRTTFENMAGQFDENLPLNTQMAMITKDLPLKSPLLKMTKPQLVAYLNSSDPEAVKKKTQQIIHLGLCHSILACYHDDVGFRAETTGESRYLTKVVRTPTKGNYWHRRGVDVHTWIPKDYFP